MAIEIVEEIRGIVNLDEWRRALHFHARVIVLALIAMRENASKRTVIKSACVLCPASERLLFFAKRIWVLK